MKKMTVKKLWATAAVSAMIAESVLNKSKVVITVFETTLVCT